jgi:predicted Zn-dependent peptidase
MTPRIATLQNGLTIIAQPMPAARSIAMAVVLRSGARQDLRLGTAHFLEHMLFKGNQEFSALELSKAFDTLGAHANAFTSHETTTYTASGLPKTQSELTRLLLGMQTPRLDETDIELERQVILEEIELYRDDPMSLALESSAAHYFKSHPLGRPVIGLSSTVASISKTDLQDYLSDHYNTSNMVLAVCGIFDWEQLQEDAQMFSQALPMGQFLETKTLGFNPQSGRILVPHDCTHNQISFIARGFKAGHELELPAAIASRIIGDSENSRFTWALVDDGTALSAGLEHEGHTDLGAFYGSLECSPEHSSQCIERLQNELLKVRQNGITTQELNRMKRKLEVGLALRLETPSAWLGAFAEDYVLQNDLREPNAILEELRNVTLDQVNTALLESGLEQPFIVNLGTHTELS